MDGQKACCPNVNFCQCSKAKIFLPASSKASSSVIKGVSFEHCATVGDIKACERVSVRSKSRANELSQGASQEGCVSREMLLRRVLSHEREES